jgi:YbbR domain-containing protein
VTVTRLLRIVVHNWPLKLAAVGLATLLYGGLVLSQSASTFDDAPIQVDVRNLPEGAFLPTNPAPVTEIRYFSASGVRPIASTFEAWVDLGDIPVGGEPVSVPVQVRSRDDQIVVVSHTPNLVTVTLETLETKEVDVRVEFPPPPEGVGIGDVISEPATVTVSGPASAVERVAYARADVLIQASVLAVDQDVPLIAVDALGDAVTPINIEPRTVRVRIPVFEDLRSKTLPVAPIITGSPAPGFEIATVTVDPSVVTVQGDAEQLAGLRRLDTTPVSTNNASDTFEVAVDLALPPGIVAVDAPQVTVVVTLRPVTATRTFEAGLQLTGARDDHTYALDVDRVLLTLGGSVADLDRLQGQRLVARLDVAALEPGTTPVRVGIDLPAGVTLVASSPPTVGVTVTGPAAAASPQPAAPAASPGG